MNSDRKIGLFSSNIDFLTIGIYMLLVIIGWLNIYSVVHESDAVFDFSSRYGKQLIWAVVSLVVGISIVLIDSRYYHLLSYPFYWLALALMVGVLMFGSTINGARSWLSIGPVSLQPVEFMKIATALALAKFMSSYHFSIQHSRSLFIVAAIIFIPAFVVLLQNDTGSALVFSAFFIVLFREGFGSAIYLVSLYWFIIVVLTFFLTPAALVLIIFLSCVAFEWISNARKEGVLSNLIRYTAIVLGLVLAISGLCLLFDWDLGLGVILPISVGMTSPLLVYYALRGRSRTVLAYFSLFVISVALAFSVDYVFNNVLQPHQQERILDLVGIESDPQGAGYNAMQSKIAIGSGGVMGKGFMQGTQTRFSFVPEQSTDFIFCTVGEEWGFVGSVVVVVLFALLIFRLMRMGERQKEPFARIYCYSVASIIFVHFFINIAMTIGLFPIIGIPLPFFSYGGSSLLAFSIMLFIAVRLDSSQSEGTDRRLL